MTSARPRSQAPAWERPRREAPLRNAYDRLSVRAICSLAFIGTCAELTDASPAAEPQSITTDGRFKQRPCFSPDGHSVVFARHEEATIRLYRRDLATGVEARLSDKSNPMFDAVYSPDSASLVFAYDETTPNQGNIDVYRLTLADRSLTKLVGDGGSLSHEESPCWSPDGKRIAFTSTRDGNQELYVANADGGDLVRLTSDPAIDAHPAWSPDGTMIAFATNRWGDLELAAIAPDGSQLRRLTDSPGLDDYPAWSPDGRQLAWTSNRDGNLEIYISPLPFSATTEAMNFTRHPSIDNFSAWTPGGELSCISNRNGGFELYLIGGEN